MILAFLAHFVHVSELVGVVLFIVCQVHIYGEPLSHYVFRILDNNLNIS